MQGIPTLGPRGIRFRSRIEAQWAYVFEHVGFQWDYEPIDLHMYIPDFIIKFDNSSILVEIKSNLNIWNENENKDANSKILKSGWSGLYMILGSAFKQGTHDGWHNIGVYGSDQEGIIDDIVIRQHSMYHKNGGKENVWTLGGDTMTYDIGLESYKLGFVNHLDSNVPTWKCTNNTDFNYIWSKAKNNSQWNKK